VVALVPAFNEEASIAHVVTSLSRLGTISEVVVVTDGCTDRTAQEASAAGAWVWSAPRRMGKGRAVEAALDWVGPADAFVLVDGDVAQTAAHAGPLLDEVLRGRLDLAIGRLPPLPGGGFGMVKGLAGWLIRSLTGFRAEEPLSGQRAATSQALGACRPLASGFGMETAMTIDAVRLGFRVGEVPVTMAHRPTRRSLAGFAHRGLQGMHILRAVVPRALRLR
jgi:hypothetical protein